MDSKAVTLLVLTAAQVRAVLPMREAILAMGAAFRAFSSGTALVPQRTRIDIPGGDSHALFMPVFMEGRDPVLAVKAVQVYPGNHNTVLPVVSASVLLMDGRTGMPVACIEGSSLTAIRTGAASGLATDLLSRPDSGSLCIIGAGVQAWTQLEAVCAVRDISRVSLYDPTPAKARAIIAGMAGKQTIPENMVVAENTRDAVSGADILCTATTSHRPVFHSGDIEDGVHINAIGSYLPTMQEIPEEVICRAKVFVDSRDAVMAESGDLIIPIERGLISPGHVHAEIGEILGGKKTGRTENGEITLFKSVGIAVQDAAAAYAAYQNAHSRGIGQWIDWLE